MTQMTEQLLNQAMQLEPSEREQLAERLFLSLETSPESDEGVESAWGDEIAQRVADVDSGHATLVAQEQVHDAIRNLLNRE